MEWYVSLTIAKQHVNVVGTFDDAILEVYLEAAHRIVLDRLERATTDSDLLALMVAWTAETVPGPVKAAVLVQLAELYRFRGDDPEAVAAEPGRLSKNVERFIGPWLERVIA
jgi:Phage gp6-like head-tail connector protein